MTGQAHDDVVSLVVLALDTDGKQIGWHVFNVQEMSWKWAGIGNNGSRATVTVVGDFHRMDRQPHVDELAAAALALEKGRS